MRKAIHQALQSSAALLQVNERAKAAPSGVKLAPRSVVSCKGFRCAQ
jgi:hypothetical protein